MSKKIKILIFIGILFLIFIFLNFISPKSSQIEGNIVLIERTIVNDYDANAPFLYKNVLDGNFKLEGRTDSIVFSSTSKTYASNLDYVELCSDIINCKNKNYLFDFDPYPISNMVKGEFQNIFELSNWENIHYKIKLTKAKIYIPAQINNYNNPEIVLGIKTNNPNTINLILRYNKLDSANSDTKAIIKTSKAFQIQENNFNSQNMPYEIRFFPPVIPNEVSIYTKPSTGYPLILSKNSSINLNSISKGYFNISEGNGFIIIKNQLQNQQISFTNNDKIHLMFNNIDININNIEIANDLALINITLRGDSNYFSVNNKNQLLVGIIAYPFKFYGFISNLFTPIITVLILFILGIFVIAFFKFKGWEYRQDKLAEKVVKIFKKKK